MNPHALPCRRISGGCTLPAAVTLTWQEAPVHAPGAVLPGLTFATNFCRADADAHAATIVREGGSVVGEKALPEPTPPPAPILPPPVGLDAIDPPKPATPPRPGCAAWAAHPGEIVAEEMAERGWTLERTASDLRWSNGLLRTVLDGSQDVKPGLAADLARVFGLSAGMWLRLQESYSAWKAQQPAETGVS